MREAESILRGTIDGQASRERASARPLIRIAVLIPCDNEAATIQKVVGDFRQELPEATISVYDNNSDDGTG